MPYLIQAIMPFDSELLQLEGIDSGIIRRLKQEGISTLHEMRSHSENELFTIFEKCRIEKKTIEKVRN